METFNIKISDLVIKINANYGFAKKFCKDYLTKEKEQLTISVSEQEIQQEMEQTNHKFLSEQVETTCIYRNIAKLLPLNDRFVMHAVALEYNKKAYLFIAPSGVGKTTHALLWKKYLEQANIINGDKPILKMENNKIFVYSCPWAGKENFKTNIVAPLEAVCIISQAKENKIEKIKLEENLTDVINQIYMPTEVTATEKTLDFLNVLCNQRVYKLKCDISYEAFKTCFDTLVK